MPASTTSFGEVGAPVVRHEIVGGRAGDDHGPFDPHPDIDQDADREEDRHVAPRPLENKRQRGKDVEKVKRPVDRRDSAVIRQLIILDVEPVAAVPGKQLLD